MAIVRTGDRLAILAIEAKVDETFGPTVKDWLEKDETEPATRRRRLVSLCGLLGLDPGKVDHIRRSEEHTSELQSLMARSYAVFCFTSTAVRRRLRQDTRPPRQAQKLP